MILNYYLTKFFWTFVILSAILLPTKSQITSFFWCFLNRSLFLALKVRDNIFILNVILFYFLFMCNLIAGLTVFSLCFWIYIRNNLECLLYNLIHQVIHVLHSMLIPCWSWNFEFIVLIRLFYLFSCLVNAKIW